jgi:hypothetical protein
MRSHSLYIVWVNIEFEILNIVYMFPPKLEKRKGAMKTHSDDIQQVRKWTWLISEIWPKPVL